MNKPSKMFSLSWIEFAKLNEKFRIFYLFVNQNSYKIFLKKLKIINFKI